ncbi:MAG TPA: hypothetical protein VFH47_03755, partial [Candidatus Thermoplasmatota archaeon]|nr:hypothetical protein [Candidatus Thermoplasmatota archaeon]
IWVTSVLRCGTRWDTDLVCFGHHTDAERLQRARELGATKVWTNGELDRRIADVLRQAEA